MSTYDVRFWDIRRNANKRRPWEVRWVVAGRQKSRSFSTKALSDGFRSQLVTAARDGEPFDEDTGLPESFARGERGPSWFDHACAYVQMKWPRAAAKSRRSMAEALATVTPALVAHRRGMPEPDVLRAALYGWAFNPGRPVDDQPPKVKLALDWLSTASLRVSKLADPGVVRQALDSLAVTVDGRPAAATTVRRKRAVFYNCLGFAVELGLLASNPVDRVQWRAPEVAETVDRRVVANPQQVRQLLDAVGGQGERGRHLVAFFACLYFAGLRPSEAVALRADNCVLPEGGWGRLDLTRSAPRAGAVWTDDGNVREVRGLKRRARDTVRSVPAPEELVRILRGHLDEFGTAQDGRLFHTQTGGPLNETTYGSAWRRAREAALTPAQVESPLARRPYDLRHAAVSLWLNAGVPATEAARRAGHGVGVMLSVYANCLDGQEEVANARIDAALVEDRATLLPGASAFAPAEGAGAKPAGHSRDGQPDGLGLPGEAAGQEGSHSGLVRRS